MRRRSRHETYGPHRSWRQIIVAYPSERLPEITGNNDQPICLIQVPLTQSYILAQRKRSPPERETPPLAHVAATDRR